ncbi:MAG: aminotransferase [Candidatus Pelagibacter sp. TMED239]|nr:MAG: aminotransferase [Candidatus Pelagibacter sp. TMED239]|tara:strand:+ start:527 stop:1300 length:774 start_codon:yes stop_codon:yes gene_type:complete
MAKLLLKKSYRHKDLKEIKFQNLWNSYGVFTTMRVIGKPAKILFFKDHMNNLFSSLKNYKIYYKDIKKDILKLIRININDKIKYDHLFRVAVNKKIISVSLRKRLKPKLDFKLKLINYKRIDPEYKNLKYKKILSYLKRMDTKKSDIALYKDNNILETGTSNLLFLKKNKIYSPLNNFYKGTTFKFFTKKLKKIIRKNISIKSLNHYDEIIVIGSGKGVVSVNSIEKSFWKRKSLKNYRILSRIYQKAVTNCPPYNS